MVIGGLQKNSFIDYPGKVSCVLFLSGCNFDCPYCHNPNLTKSVPPGQSKIQETTVFDFLKHRKTFLDGVVISGGEPTLQHDLIDSCDKIKTLGYSVKLDTNGSKPRVLEQLIKKSLIDYIAMDIKTDPFHYAPHISPHINPYDLISSIQIILSSGLPYEFKTTCIKPIVDEVVIEKIAALIKGATLYALQQCHFSNVLHPEFFDHQDRLYSDKELLQFQSIASPWVRKCIVR